MITKEFDYRQGTDQELQKAHNELHVAYQQKEETGEFHSPASISWSLEDIWNLHKLIVEEMERRKITHEAIDELDETELLGLYKQPIPGSKGEYPEVRLEDFLSHIGPARLSMPFVFLVGSLPNHGKTKGDFDILVKTSEHDRINLPLQFRVLRMFPPELRKRIHFLHDDTSGIQTSGPFTSFVPLFSLELIPITPLQRVEMSKKEMEVIHRAIHQIVTSPKVPVSPVSEYRNINIGPQKVKQPNVHVSPGTNVRFTNRADKPIKIGGDFTSPEIPPNGRWYKVFDKAGKFEYEVKPYGWKGVINVEES